MPNDDRLSHDAQVIHRGLMMVVDAVADLKSIILAAQDEMTKPVRLAPGQIQEIASAVAAALRGKK